MQLCWVILRQHSPAQGELWKAARPQGRDRADPLARCCRDLQNPSTQHRWEELQTLETGKGLFHGNLWNYLPQDATGIQCPHSGSPGCLGNETTCMHISQDAGLRSSLGSLERLSVTVYGA